MESQIVNSKRKFLSVAISMRAGYCLSKGRTRMRRITWWTLGLVLAIGAVRVPLADGFGTILTLGPDEDRLESRCRLQSISAKFSPAVSQYDSSGVCETWFISGYNGKEEFRDRIRWEATGKHSPNLSETEENISLLRLVRPDQPNYFSVGKITAKMKCKQDPWVNPDRFGCTDLFYGRSESLQKYNLDGLYAKEKSMPRTSLILPEQRAALNQQYQRYLALRQQYKPDSGNLQMKNPSIQPKSQVSGATGSAQCKPGFVWRLAGPADYVCVEGESHQRALQENATAASRRNPKGGAYGPNTCLAGFVWRGAFAGDVVCVTPEVRRLVQRENELSSSRSTGAGQLMRR